jgi:hypothetical protein
MYLSFSKIYHLSLRLPLSCGMDPTTVISIYSQTCVLQLIRTLAPPSQLRPPHTLYRPQHTIILSCRIRRNEGNISIASDMQLSSPSSVHWLWIMHYGPHLKTGISVANVLFEDAHKSSSKPRIYRNHDQPTVVLYTTSSKLTSTKPRLLTARLRHVTSWIRPETEQSMPFRNLGHYNTGCEILTPICQNGLWKPYAMLLGLVLELALYYEFQHMLIDLISQN